MGAVGLGMLGACHSWEPLQSRTIRVREGSQHCLLVCDYLGKFGRELEVSWSVDGPFFHTEGTWDTVGCRIHFNKVKDASIMFQPFCLWEALRVKGPDPWSVRPA